MSSPETSPNAEIEDLPLLWNRGVEIWTTYLVDLLQVRGMEDLARVQTRLFLDSLDIVGQAAGDRFKLLGLTQPTLNEP